MVLEWEMDDAGDGERERGGMIEAEDDEGGAEAGPEAEAEEETIEGAGRGMGTDMVVMSDAISSSYALACSLPFLVGGSAGWYFAARHLLAGDGKSG